MTPFTDNASSFGSFTDPLRIACNNELLFHTSESLTRPLDPTSAYKHSYSGSAIAKSIIECVCL